MGEWERQVVVKQYIAAHSSGWRVLRLGRGVVRCDSTLQEGCVVTLEVRASTLSGRTLPIALHHETRVSRQPLLILFNSLSSNTTLHTAARFQGDYLGIYSSLYGERDCNTSKFDLKA